MKLTAYRILVYCFILWSCSKPENDNKPPAEIIDPVKAIVLCSATNAARVRNITVYNENGSVKWQKSRDFSFPPSGATTYSNSRLYYNTGSGIEAYDINNGNLLWKRNELTSLPAVTDSALYACSTHYIFEINPKTGELLSDLSSVSQLVPLKPAFSNGVLFVVTSTYYADYSIRAFDVKTKTIKWITPIGINPPSDLVVSNGILCTVNGAGSLLGIDVNTGAVKWKKTDKGYGNYLIRNNTIYAEAGGVTAIDIQTGAAKWEWPLPPQSYHGRNFYFNGENLSFEYTTGNQLKAISVKNETGELISEKIEADNGLYVNVRAQKGGDKIYKIRVFPTTTYEVKLVIFDASKYAEMNSVLIKDEYMEDFMVITKSQN